MQKKENSQRKSTWQFLSFKSIIPMKKCSSCSRTEDLKQEKKSNLDMPSCLKTRWSERKVFKFWKKGKQKSIDRMLEGRTALDLNTDIKIGKTWEIISVLLIMASQSEIYICPKTKPCMRRRQQTFFSQILNCLKRGWTQCSTRMKEDTRSQRNKIPKELVQEENTSKGDFKNNFERKSPEGY